MKNKIIFDLTSRLPGPLSTKTLEQLGFKIIKFENICKDAFKQSKIKSFAHWYDDLNKNKEIINTDMSKDFLKEQIEKYKPEFIISQKQPKDNFGQKWLVIKGNKSSTPLHDLNVWSELGFIKNTTLPFLPFAGIMFSQIIVQNILSLNSLNDHTKNIKTIYLVDELKKLLSPFLKNEEKTLHQGKFPCYQIYELQDGFISLACIEEKFWKEFCELFKLNFSLEDAFDQTSSVKHFLKLHLKQLTRKKANELLSGRDICISIT